LAEQHAELDRTPLVVPPGVLWEGKKDHCDLRGMKASCSYIVLLPGDAGRCNAEMKYGRSELRAVLRHPCGQGRAIAQELRA
jgi:hypothetical protein